MTWLLRNPGRISADLYFKQGLEQLRTFLLGCGQLPRLRFCTRKNGLTCKLRDEVAGRIDRMDRTRRSVAIVDYKTGKARSQKMLTKVCSFRLRYGAREKWGYRVGALMFIISKQRERPLEAHGFQLEEARKSADVAPASRKGTSILNLIFTAVFAHSRIVPREKSGSMLSERSEVAGLIDAHFCPKNLGAFWRPPLFLTSYDFLMLLFFFAFFLVPLVLFSFHFSWKNLQRSFVQLIDCIELMKNEVKKKMHVCSLRRVPKSLRDKSEARISDRVIRMHRKRALARTKGSGDHRARLNYSCAEELTRRAALRRSSLSRAAASIMAVANLRGSMINGAFDDVVIISGCRTQWENFWAVSPI